MHDYGTYTQVNSSVALYLQVTGDVIAQRSLAIDPGWSAGDLHDALAPLGADMLIDVLADIDAAIAGSVAQDDARATYAPRLEKQQAEVDWRKPAAQILREIRAYNPWPVSFSFIRGDNLRLWQACLNRELRAQQPGQVVAHDRDGVYISCGDGVLQVTELQFAGRKRCSAAQALNGADLNGLRLGREP